MQQALLSTKFNLPTSCQRLVHRTRLMEMLAPASIYPITLVSAPPGYGKTALVSSWLRGATLPFTWLSLDEGDNDPVRFLGYFLAALHTVVPAIQPDMLDLPRSQAASYEMLMVLIINAAAGVGDFFLVLDDFQALSAEPVLDMLGYLFEHLPPDMHIVLISRSDPPLALSRLRARGQLLEIRAEQLRFTSTEIAQFYEEVMQLPLSAADVSAMEARTEGWIAGLQLAGLAMQSEKSPQRFITAFTGSHAYIMDYLTEEVLRGQSESVRLFLLQTAILDRMCGPLCEAVVESDKPEYSDCQVILETIERNHLFIIPLDAERRWFRYHHLFKEVLSRRLEVLSPEKIPILHRRASEWYEQQGYIYEAVQHAQKAGDSERIARLVEQHGCALLMAGELFTLADWLAAVDPYTHTRPWLAMQKAWVLALKSQFERAEIAINDGELLIADFEMTEEVSTIRGSFSAARALWANMQGKNDLAAACARQAIDLLNSSGDFSCALRSVATSLLGDTSWVQGKLEEARRSYEEAVQIGRVAGNPHMTMMSMTSLADVLFEQGHFHQAAGLYAETLHMAEQVDGPNSAYALGVHLGLSRVYYAWNRLDEAAESAERAYQLALRWGNVNLQVACLALNARLDLSYGRLEKAQSIAIVIEEVIRSHSLSAYWLAWVNTELARCWMMLGQIDQALIHLHKIGILPDSFTPEDLSRTSLPLEDPIAYRQVPAYMILARLYLALGNPDAAFAIVECLVQEALVWGWGKSAAELLIIQALALQMKRDSASSLAAFEKAVSSAWSEQSIRIFLDEGPAVGKLLYQAKAHGIGGAFVGELLSLMDQQAPLTQRTAGDHAVIGASNTESGRVSSLITAAEDQRGNHFLVEPLSARELEVLRYIADGYSNQQIADRFVLSPLTIKRHISNIYAKLEAKNRTQAVFLARALKLID